VDFLNFNKIIDVIDVGENNLTRLQTKSKLFAVFFSLFRMCYINRSTDLNELKEIFRKPSFRKIQFMISNGILISELFIFYPNVVCALFIYFISSP
jgi:hypothetical protein